MSTALIEFSNDEIELLSKTIGADLDRNQLALFIQVCKQTGLNPFAKQIYPVLRNQKKPGTKNEWEKRMTIQTGIDGFRLLAQRSREYAGQEGPWWYDDKKKEWTDVWLESYPPAAAKVGVMRKGFIKPIYSVARFNSYAARYDDGNLMNLWAKMPEVMISKVAEALALRRGFPAELSGLYTAEEMAQADNTDAQTVVAATGKVVESTVEPAKATHQQEDPVPTLSELKEHSERLYPGRWESIKATALKAQVQDDDITPAQALKIHKALLYWEAKQAEKAAQTQEQAVEVEAQAS